MLSITCGDPSADSMATCTLDQSETFAISGLLKNKNPAEAGLGSNRMG